MFTAKLMTQYGTAYAMTGLSDLAVENMMYAKNSGTVYTAHGPNGMKSIVDMAHITFIEITPEG